MTIHVGTGNKQDHILLIIVVTTYLIGVNFHKEVLGGIESGVSPGAWLQPVAI